MAGLGGPYDLVVSNPPYVAQDEIDTLQPEVREWEPRLALVGGGHTEAIAELRARRSFPAGVSCSRSPTARAGAVAELLERLGYDGRRRDGRISRAATGSSRGDGRDRDAVDGAPGGQDVVLPTDTVYGLCVSPYREEPARGSS